MGCQCVIRYAVAFSNQVQHRFAGLEENFNLPAFSINTNDLFFGKSRICADKSKPLLAIRFVPYTNSLRLGELLGLTWDCVDISPEAIEENRAYVFINKESQRMQSFLKERSTRKRIWIHRCTHNRKIIMQLLPMKLIRNFWQKYWQIRRCGHCSIHWRRQ